MKNLYLSAFAAILCCTGTYAQEHHNANWYFGYNAGLNFLPDPNNPTSIATGLQTLEAPASYSSVAGKLLFYTNGREVYNGDHTPMANGTGLKSHTSAGQGALIVRKPIDITTPQVMAVGENENLYIITLDGLSGTKQGLYYSEVNVNELTAIGAVTNKNIVLNDHNNVPIGLNYKSLGNNSEKLTSAPHCNGRDYWIVTQIGGFIYSYLVSPNGISSTPTTISAAPIDLQTTTGAAGALGQIKISPANDRLGIAYYSSGSVVKSGVLALGNFDSSTGAVVFDGSFIEIPVSPEPNDDGYPWGTQLMGVEFSPDSQQVYFSTTYQMFRGDAYNASSANVQLVDAINNTPQARFMTAMQLAMDGKIYVVVEDINDNTNISRINAPNNTINPDYRINDVILQNGTPGGAFPGWVHSQLGGCAASYELFKPELSMVPHVYKVGQSIITTQNYKVGAGKNITAKAGRSVIMFENTSIEAGSIFLAEIEECLCEASSEFSSGGETQGMRMNIIPEGLQLYPNPATDYANISVAEDVITSVTVTSMNGQILFRRSNDSSNFSLNTSSYTKGIYLVSVQTKNNKTYNEKLMIN